MKRRNRIILPIVASALLFSSFSMVACNGGGEKPAEQQEKIVVKTADNKTSATVILGKTLQLTASVEGATWSSGDETIATVNSAGLVTSIKVGRTTIKANKKGYREGSFNLTVDLEKITITASANSVEMGQTITLTASEQGVTWSSSDENIATVNNGVVTGVYVGSATIKAEKEGFNAGTLAVTVTRPAATAELHFEQADHYAADGWWGSEEAGYSPVYERSSGNASDGTCIAHFANGDKETLTFTSSAAVQAELVITMASSSAIDAMNSVMDAKFNNVAIDLTGKSFTGGSSSTFSEFSLGNLTLASNNVLEISFKDASVYPYLDNLNVYAKAATTVAQVNAPEKERIIPSQTTMIAGIDEQTQIVLTTPASLDGVSFVSDKEEVATVDEQGKVTGHKLGTANITIKKDGWLSARIEVVADKAALPGEIRVQAEDAEEIPSGFHKYTDKTTGIQNGHYGGAYITGYDVSSECSLSYKFNSDKNQSMTLIIAGASHYQMSEDFVFGVDCKIKLNGQEVTVNEGAKIESNQVMGAPTVEVTIGNVNVKVGENTFVLEFTNRAPALDAYRFIPNS